MPLSDEFKQALRSGDLSKAFTMVASKATSLNITTRIVRQPGQGETYDPDTSLHTQIDLINGTIENEVGEALLNNQQYQNLQHFHQQQVAQGNRKIQENFQGLQQLFQLLVTLQQYDRLLNAETPLDLKFLEVPNQTLAAQTVKVIEPFPETRPQDQSPTPLEPVNTPAAPTNAVEEADADPSEALNFLDDFADLALDEEPESDALNDASLDVKEWDNAIDEIPGPWNEAEDADIYIPTLADFEPDDFEEDDTTDALAGIEDLDEPGADQIVADTADLDTVDDEALFSFLNRDWHKHPAVTEVTSLDDPTATPQPELLDLPPLPEDWLEQELATEEISPTDDTTAAANFADDLGLGELPEDELGDRLSEEIADIRALELEDRSQEETLDTAELETIDDLSDEELAALDDADFDSLLGVDPFGDNGAIAAESTNLPLDLADLDALDLEPSGLAGDRLGTLQDPESDPDSLAFDADFDPDHSDFEDDLDLDDDFDFGLTDTAAPTMSTDIAEAPLELEKLDLGFDDSLGELDDLGATGDEDFLDAPMDDTSSGDKALLDLDLGDMSDIDPENFDTLGKLDLGLDPGKETIFQVDEPQKESSPDALDDLELDSLDLDLDTSMLPAETADLAADLWDDAPGTDQELLSLDDVSADLTESNSEGDLDDLTFDDLGDLELAIDNDGLDLVIIDEPPAVSSPDTSDDLDLDSLDLDLDASMLPPETMDLWAETEEPAQAMPDPEDINGSSSGNLNEFADDSWLDSLDLSGELEADLGIALDDPGKSTGESNFNGEEDDGSWDSLAATDITLDDTDWDDLAEKPAPPEDDVAIAFPEDLGLDSDLGDLGDLENFDFDGSGLEDLDFDPDSLQLLEEESSQ